MSRDRGLYGSFFISGEMENRLKETLISAAHAEGICTEGYKQMLGSADVESMVDYYTANPDWCLERGFPDMKTLRKHFADISHKGVFVDHTFKGELLNDLQAYIFHNCKGTIKVGLNVDKAIIPMLYLANGCRLRIVGVGEIVPEKPTVLPIYTFGKNDVSAKGNKYVEFITYKNELI